MKRYFPLATIIAIIILGIVWLFPKRDIQVSSPKKAIIDALSFGSFLKANYSFGTDADLDGLTDAKEIIYGSDPLNADSDGDGFLDGKEVINGFDPIVAGKDTGKLLWRENLSLTIQYFIWLQKKTRNPDPQLEEVFIQEFLGEKGLLTFSLPPIVESEITFTNDDPQKIASYLTLTNSLTLPEEGSPYLALAGQLLKNQSLGMLNTLLKTVSNQSRTLMRAQVPPSLIELHRMYAGIWKELQTIFEGLKHAQQDPILIYLNQKKGEWLVEKIKETEKLRTQLIAEMKLSPFKNEN